MHNPKPLPELQRVDCPIRIGVVLERHLEYAGAVPSSSGTARVVDLGVPGSARPMVSMTTAAGRCGSARRGS